jgi:hypothetical protein
LSPRLLFLWFNQSYLLRIVVLFICLSSVSLLTAGQVATDTVKAGADSIAAPDTLVQHADSSAIPSSDSVSKKPTDTLWNASGNLPLKEQVLQRHPYFRFNVKPVVMQSDQRQFHGKEMLFYVVIFLLIIFGLLKLGFAKYFSDLLRVFFRTTLKQRQIKEQLIQTPLPSLMFNIFFVASAGLYMNFLFHHFKFTPVNNFWLMYLYCCIGLSVVYLVKYVGLKICGWLFNMRQAADSYIFIVFIINKVIGFSVLPFIILLAFTDGTVYTVSLILSLFSVGGLFLYRFILGYGAIHNEVKFNLFHFFLYICAFEVAPLLLIYKLLLFFL